MRYVGYRVLALVLGLAAAALFFHQIGRHSLWGDELQTVEVIARHTQRELWNSPDPSKMEEYFSMGFLVPYYSLARVWSQAFGLSEAAVRSLSAVCTLLALGMILGWGPVRWGLGRRASLAAAALFALSPMMLWYAQEARYYALLQVLGLCALGFYRDYWRTGKGRWLVAWSLTAAISLMTHPFMVFLAAGMVFRGIWLWWRSRWERPVLFLAGHGFVAIVFSLMFRPLLVSNSRVIAHQAYSLPVDDLIPWKVFSNYLFGIYEHPFVPLASLLLASATVLLVLQVRDAWRMDLETVRSGRKVSASDPMLWVCTVMVGLAFMIAVSMVHPIMVEGKKYEIIFFAPFCVCLGSALASPKRARWLPPAFLGVFWLNASMTNWLYYENPQKQNWRMAGYAVRRLAQAGDIWLHQSVWRGFASEYYAQGPSRGVVDVVWPPYHLEGRLPAEVRSAHRVWLVKTGGIADVYEARLVKDGFQRALTFEFPSGSHFMTQLWLFEKRSP